MTSLLAKFLRFTLLFFRTLLGCIQNPYVTYRTMAQDPVEGGSIYWIGVLIALYFVFASLIRNGLQNPYLLTLKFNTLTVAASIGFLGMIFVLVVLGRLFGSQAKVKTVCVLWSYTLLPTVSWFFFTSIMYILLPPPRTITPPGMLYSAVFLAVSGTLLWWKLILYYLTLRFGLKMDLKKIIGVSGFVLPILIAYSIVMYRLGIFRIPFI